MINLLFSVLLSLCVSQSVLASTPNLLDTLSPKLKVFLFDHPAAQAVLTNTLSQAFARRSVALYYFYSLSANKG